MPNRLPDFPISPLKRIYWIPLMGYFLNALAAKPEQKRKSLLISAFGSFPLWSLGLTSLTIPISTRIPRDYSLLLLLAFYSAFLILFALVTNFETKYVMRTKKANSKLYRCLTGICSSVYRQRKFKKDSHSQTITKLFLQSLESRCS